MGWWVSVDITGISDAFFRTSNIPDKYTFLFTLFDPYNSI